MRCLLFLLVIIHTTWTSSSSSPSVQQISFTAKGLEIYEDARALALDNGNPQVRTTERSRFFSRRSTPTNHKQIDMMHVLKAVFSDSSSFGQRILRKAAGKKDPKKKVKSFLKAISRRVGSLPRQNPAPTNLALSSETENLFKEAEKSRLEVKAHLIGLDHLILAVTNQRKVIELLGSSFVARIRSEIKQIQARRKERDARETTTEESSSQQQNKQHDEGFLALETFARDLVTLSDSLDPVIGRDKEIRRVLQILSRRKKNNPILVGYPGT